jgi:spore coat protein U-like protein
MKITKLLRATGIIGSMALILNGAAMATTTSGSLPVSASITNTCVFGTINTLSFTYDPVVANSSTGTDATSSATFALTCTSGVAITIGMSLGAQPVTTQRYMKDAGTDTLAYNLFQDSGDTTAWDETTTKSDNATGSAVTYTVYGVVPHGQNKPAGTYTDTVSIDVNY